MKITIFTTRLHVCCGLFDRMRLQVQRTHTFRRCDLSVEPGPLRTPMQPAASVRSSTWRVESRLTAAQQRTGGIQRQRSIAMMTYSDNDA
ncbi:hypothetical protein EEB11_17875 [Pseudotabrizicola sediminis]|uniref:Uncharacterized protein n=1 Tax=Pseudotabrizicola sediminis TaxID=2486418 RepID=A0ABY2KH76_9RHOB|nr:hypothetical protein EEB11_17875 [Pseudotabrizicola sediminis]